VHLQLPILRFDFVGLLADVAVSELAFAFASRDFDGWLLLPAHILGSGRLCTDGSDLKHNVSLHSEVQDTFDLYTPQYASIIASSLHSEVSQDIVHHHVGIWQHVSVAITVVADDEEPADDPILGDFQLSRGHFVAVDSEPELELVAAQLQVLAAGAPDSVSVLAEQGSPMVDSLSGLFQQH